MNKTVSNIAAFLLGAASGSAVTWYISKKYYDKITQEEIDSVKSVNWKSPIKETKKEETPKEPEKKFDADADIYKSAPNKTNYTNYSNSEVFKNTKEEPEKEEKLAKDKPYVISPEEFGEFYDYEKVSLTCYSDKTVADDDYEIVDDIKNTIGLKALESFGEYENDSVFVRNDRLKTDYEILLDEQTYEDALRDRPYIK